MGGNSAQVFGITFQCPNPKIILARKCLIMKLNIARPPLSFKNLHQDLNVDLMLSLSVPDPEVRKMAIMEEAHSTLRF